VGLFLFANSQGIPLHDETFPWWFGLASSVAAIMVLAALGYVTWYSVEALNRRLARRRAGRS
jgi:hypothetical protein